MCAPSLHSRGAGLLQERGAKSTLVAARELGLRAIGIELTEHYYHIARARLAEQLPLAVHS